MAARETRASLPRHAACGAPPATWALLAGTYQSWCCWRPLRSPSANPCRPRRVANVQQHVTALAMAPISVHRAIIADGKRRISDAQISRYHHAHERPYQARNYGFGPAAQALDKVTASHRGIFAPVRARVMGFDAVQLERYNFSSMRRTDDEPQRKRASNPKEPV